MAAAVAFLAAHTDCTSSQSFAEEVVDNYCTDRSFRRDFEQEAAGMNSAVAAGGAITPVGEAPFAQPWAKFG